MRCPGWTEFCSRICVNRLHCNAGPLPDPDKPEAKGTSWRTGQRWGTEGARGFPPAPLSLPLEFSAKVGKDFAL